MAAFPPTRRQPIRLPWPLTFCPKPNGKAPAERLAQDVRKFGHLTTGFLGTPLLCQVLSDYGYLDEAYHAAEPQGVSVMVVTL